MVAIKAVSRKAEQEWRSNSPLESIDWHRTRITIAKSEYLRLPFFAKQVGLVSLCRLIMVGLTIAADICDP